MLAATDSNALLLLLFIIYEEKSKEIIKWKNI